MSGLDVYYAQHDPAATVADAREHIYKKFLDNIGKDVDGRDLCDIGCGYGVFVNLAQRQGWYAQGIEVNTALVEKGQKELGLTLQCQDVSEWDAEQDFDVITMWNVFDELPDPFIVLEKTYEALKNDGKLFLRLPNHSFHWNIHKLQKIFPQLFKVNPIFHRFNFTPHAIKDLLHHKGFTDVKIQNATPTQGDPYTGKVYIAWAKKIFFYSAQIIHFLSCGYIKIAPSMDITATKRKTRVLHVITRLDKGGSSTNTLETMARLDQEKYELVLIYGQTHDPNQEVQKFLQRHNIHAVLMPSLKRDLHPWYDAKAFFQLCQYLSQNKIDIVHTHSSKAGILGRWAAWWMRVKHIVHTPHGHVFYGYFGALKSWVFIMIEQMCAWVTDRIITLTHQGKQDHIDYNIGPAEKFIPIYSGIDVEVYQKANDQNDVYRQEFGIPENHKIIGSVARLDPIKGNDYVLEAFISLAKKYDDVSLLFIGDGEQRRELEDRVKAEGLTSRVIFAGFREDIPSLLKYLDVFVLASLNEGMGRVILEAMAAGTPVIATRVGGIPELVEDRQTGVLVDAKNSDALEVAISLLLDDNILRESLIQEAYQQVNAKFSIQKMVKDIEKVYNELEKVC